MSITKTADKAILTGTDETVTYNITVPIETLDNIDKLKIEDVLSSHLQIKEVKVNDVVAAPTPTSPLVFEWTQDELQSLLGTLPAELRIAITVQLKSGFKVSDLSRERKELGIENHATLTVNNQVELMSEPSYVKVGVADLEFRKYVQDTLNSEKTALPAGTMAKFELYRITQATSEGDTEETALVGTFTSNKNAQNIDVVQVQNLFPGDYFAIETEAPQGYVLDESRHHFQVTIDQETGLVSAVAGDEFDNFEIVNVKAEIPTPVKKVNNDDHYDLTSINDSTTIRIEVPVAKVAGWTQFELQDTLPSYLTAEDIKVEFFEGTESIDYTTAELCPCMRLPRHTVMSNSLMSLQIII